MRKKRSHDAGEASVDVSQKKQKYSPSTAKNSLLSDTASSHLRRGPPPVSQHEKGTQDLTLEPLSDTDREGQSNPQQLSEATQAYAPNPRLPTDPLQSTYSNANGGYTSPSKSLNFSVPHQYSSNESTRHRLNVGHANASIKLAPYNGHSSTLPPLPGIRDQALESVAFTHPASLSCDTATKVNISYDRLEFLGDAYIELIATRVIFPRYPNLPAGRLSQQRELLVKNETLAEYALAYGFDEKAKLPTTHRKPGKDSRKLWLKIMGDIFEAFVAAVIISDPEQGFQIAEAWLTALWESKLSSQKREDTETVDPQAKQLLATKIMGKGIKIDYREEARPEEIRREGKLVFRLGVYLTGWGWVDEHLGSGKGLSKLEAGQRAAKEALENPLTARVASVKRDFDAKVARERTRQAEAEEGEEKGSGGGSSD